ncbi:chlorophyll synthesis pathway protein BchC [Pelagibius sp.]|uniref:chlorophyll synthesis pathway protein BchC n=1 Tax=Pelagibius sp. TaxID=1931238 RepID=UPI00261520DC|nr:chlorophyll synthesis pathway protein BchC [Pelagibius sp.]
METLAVVLEKPERLVLDRLELSPPEAEDVVVDIAWSGVSTGTERLLWSGDMPAFPGMGYPLVPGYESVGWIAEAGERSGARVGEFVFVPGARCFGEVRGLFGGAAARLVVAGERVIALDSKLGERGVLMALAATAHHAIAEGCPDLIVGHGVLGRLIARLALVMGESAPTVWEQNPDRAATAEAYSVLHPDDDPRQDYNRICDVSGDHGILDSLIGRLAPGGEITLAGFYSKPLSFAFPPAFLREARLRVSAEWRDTDLAAVCRLVESGQLSLDGLITHRAEAARAEPAYRTAFNDSSCLKMILDWRHCQ